jgi:hypothetical protein
MTPTDQIATVVITTKNRKERRQKLVAARHRRREKNLGLEQETLPFEAGEKVASD